MSDFDEEGDLALNDLTEKLKEQLSTVEKEEKSYKEEKDTLKKENLEKFLLEKTGELVTEGLDTIRELKDVFVSNPDAEEIEALSQAFKAVSSALAVLKDIQVTSMKSENSKELKEMDIKAKKELTDMKNKSEDNSNKIYLTRDEVVKSLIEKSDIIEADFSKLDEEEPK
jgi:hypothetical protein